MNLMERAEVRRVAMLAELDPARQAALGQFFTPAKAATLIASMVTLDHLTGTVRILDPGAGSGSLSVALVERIRQERPDLRLELVAVETDPVVIDALRSTLRDLEVTHSICTTGVDGDYIRLVTEGDHRVTGPFDIAILNPPYGKLGANNLNRKLTALHVVDTPNLYAAFWALAVETLSPGGQCVAIVPRSWANGTYFAAFRKWLLGQMSLDRLHVFASRDTVFADTGVLQENVIVAGTKSGTSTTVALSASVGHQDEIETTIVDSNVVVVPGDKNRFVRFTDGATAVPLLAQHTLADLGLKASTGRVVDFRNRDYLSPAPHALAVPMVYQANVRDGRVVHPRAAINKAQWFVANDAKARRLTNEPGHYVVIKRFSDTEEVTSSILVTPTDRNPRNLNDPGVFACSGLSHNGRRCSHYCSHSM